MASTEMADEDSGLKISENEDQNLLRPLELQKKEKRGIVYLSIIPKLMSVAKVREIFSEYGEIDRIFLQPEVKEGERRKKKKPVKNFTEGWIEFKKKRVAKMVASHLNNKPMGGPKRNKHHDFIWNIKYLSKFKWTHLNERLAYERAVRKQRMRTEIAQAKREVTFFSQNVDLTDRLSKRKKKGGQGNTSSNRTDQNKEIEWQFKQRDLDSEIRDKKLASVSLGNMKIKKKKGLKIKAPVSEGNREDFLKSIFSNKS